LYGYVEAETSATLTSLHRQLFYWIVGAVVLHVLAVIAHIVIKKDNLVRAMITGHKPASKISEAEAIVTSRTWLAVLLVGVLTLALAWVVSSAPVPADASFD
jgi:uncharacterized membrane protein